MEQISPVHAPEIVPSDKVAHVKALENQEHETVNDKKNSINEVAVKKVDGQVPGKDMSKLETLAGAIEEFVQTREWSLKIKVHEKTGQTVVQIVSGEDGKVIRQIPPEELINLADKIEEMVGFLISKKV